MFFSTRFRWFPSHLSRKCFSKNRRNKLQTTSNSTEGSQQCLGWDILHVTWENSANIHQNPPSYWGAPAIIAVGCFHCVLMFIHCRLLWIQDAWGTKKVVANSWEEFRGTRAPVSPYSASLDRQTRVSMWGLYSIGRIIEAGFGVCWQDLTGFQDWYIKTAHRATWQRTPLPTLYNGIGHASALWIKIGFQLLHLYPPLVCPFQIWASSEDKTIMLHFDHHRQPWEAEAFPSGGADILCHFRRCCHARDHVGIPWNFRDIMECLLSSRLKDASWFARMIWT